MALINCPGCGRQISDMAESCPHCGNPINPKYNGGLTDFIQNHKLQLIAAICGIILLVIVFCSVPYISPGDTNSMAEPIEQVNGYVESDEDSSYKSVSKLMDGYFYDDSNGNEYLLDLSDIFIGMPFDECISILKNRGIVAGPLTYHEFRNGKMTEYMTNQTLKNITHIELLTEKGFGGENETLRGIRYSYYLDDQSVGKEMYDSIVDYFLTEGGQIVSSNESLDNISSSFKMGGYKVSILYSLSRWESQDFPESYFFEILGAGGPLRITYSDYDGSWGTRISE